MRVLVISDIHANLAAFEAVLDDAAGQWDIIWFLGDLVGYGPDPNECVALLRQHEHISLSGNHDWAVLGKLDIQGFNREARQAIRWTQQSLTPENRDYLDTLPPMLVQEPFTLAHGSPRQPIWEYILDGRTAAINFTFFQTAYCLVGHTHVPVIYQEKDPNLLVVRAADYSNSLQLNHTRLIINPGSVGQPRDSDERAAYGFLNTEKMTWEHRRVPYAIHETQERMRQRGLPERLITRLSYGW